VKDSSERLVSREAGAFQGLSFYVHLSDNREIDRSKSKRTLILGFSTLRRLNM